MALNIDQLFAKAEKLFSAGDEKGAERLLGEIARVSPDFQETCLHWEKGCEAGNGSFHNEAIFEFSEVIQSRFPILRAYLYRASSSRSEVGKIAENLLSSIRMNRPIPDFAEQIQLIESLLNTAISDLNYYLKKETNQAQLSLARQLLSTVRALQARKDDLKRLRR